MIRDPHPLFIVDRGSATTAAALVARVDDRRRLLASIAAPASIPVDAVLEHLVATLRSADPDLLSNLRFPADPITSGVRLEAVSRPPRTIAVLTATVRGHAALASVVARSGWNQVGATIEQDDPRSVAARLLDPAVSAVLAGADQRAGADERGGLADLSALIAAVATRRPDLPIVLAGAMANHESVIRGTSPDRVDVLPAPDARSGTPPGEHLREILVGVGRRDDDARWGLARSTELLASVLDRRVELLEVGMSGGLRAAASVPAAGRPYDLAAITSAGAALVPARIDEETIDRVATWSTEHVDRHRLRDRLHELRAHPWADAAGDGARLRMAALHAALAHLIELTPDLSARPSPDLIVVAGGAWAVAPAPIIALAVADVVRRPAAVQVAHDHARILGAIGTIADRAEAQALIADLVDDMLAPLGSVVIPGGLRTGLPAGSVVVSGSDRPARVELVPGGLAFVDLPPGIVATADFEFRGPVVLGASGRRFQVELAGGLGGLLVDLRDIPLRLPDRQDLRRELLAGWQDPLWQEPAWLGGGP
ncbi:MAG: hypothetical protein AABZ33_10855 [Chloroflexota bacterium]